MQIGMIGLGRMGANMVRRLMRHGHSCVVWDVSADAVAALADEGAAGARTLEDLVRALAPPRVVWIMVPAAYVDSTVDDLKPLLDAGDTIVDGGNSYYRDDLARSARLADSGIHYVDVGTSGGVWGLENGYCLMVGGEADTIALLTPVFEALSPGVDAASRTGDADSEPRPEERGWLHCGPSGAGHFVKMVHNGIEYGLMAAYAEGFNLLSHANAGSESRTIDAETAPLAEPSHYRYDIDVARVAEVWRRGSVIRSWLLDLTAHALLQDGGLSGYEGRVSDSGEGRWTVEAAIETGSPAPVLASALFSRFSSRGEDDFANRVLSAMRHGFGGHAEKRGDSG